MQEFYLPRTLIVIQVIFGRPLRGQREFRSGDIEELVAEHIGPGNYAKTLNRLIELGWVDAAIRREANTRGGRPSMYVYSRTDRGRREYRKVVDKLASFGIKLQ